MYLWSLQFVQSRAFGWGLPSTMLVPFGDLMNHSPDSCFNIDMLDKNLHLKQNKIYLYHHNFDKTAKKEFTEDDIYEKTTNKLRINCERLFKEDLDAVPKEI